MATLNGLPLNFGFAGNTYGITITGITGPLLQSTKHSKVADVESARSGQGDKVTNGWYDIHDEATLEWLVTGTGLSNAQTVTNLTGINPGDLLVITACPSEPGLVGTWEVQSAATIEKGNTNYAKISVPCHLRSAITAHVS